MASEKDERGWKLATSSELELKAFAWAMLAMIGKRETLKYLEDVKRSLLNNPQWREARARKRKRGH